MVEWEKCLRQYQVLLTKMLWYRRKRKPAVMLLEVLWPVALFTIVIVVRQGSLPERKTQCYYRPRSMPSAGPLKFLQTHLCGVNNMCLKEGLYKDKGRPQGIGGESTRPKPPEAHVNILSSISKAEISPELTRTLPKVLNLISSLQNTVSQPGVQEYLKGGSLSVKHFLTDDEDLKEILVHEGVVPEGLIDDFFKAEVRTTAGSKGTNGNMRTSKPTEFLFDAKQCMCDPACMDNVLDLPAAQKETYLNMVTEELCNANHDTLSDFADLIIRNLKTDDLTENILGSVQQLTTYTAKNAVEDTAIAIDTITNLTMFEDLVKELPLIGNIGGIINNVKDLIINAKEADSFDDIVALSAPIIGNIINDPEYAGDITRIARGIQGLIEFIKKATKKNKYTLADALGDDYQEFRRELVNSKPDLPFEDIAKINAVLNAEISPVELRHRSDRQSLGADWRHLTCTSQDNLTAIFKNKLNEELDILRQTLCDTNRFSETQAFNIFRHLLSYTKLMQTLDKEQKNLVLGAFDYINLIQDVAGLTVASTRFVGKTIFHIRNFKNATSGLGKRIKEAMNIEIKLDNGNGGKTYGPVEILEIVSNTIGKTPELENLADAIDLAMYITMSARDNFVHVKEVVKSPAALIAVLVGNDLTASIVDKVLSSTVNISGLLELGGADGSGIATGLCKAGQYLPSFLGLTGQNLDRDILDQIEGALCSDANIGEMIDLQALVGSTLGQTIPAYMMYGDWWVDMLGSANGVMEGIGAFIDLVSGRQIFDARLLLKVLYNTIDSLGVGGKKDIANNIPSLLGFLQDSVVTPDYFIDDLYQLSTGILSMSIFAREIPLSLNFKDYSTSPANIASFLRNQDDISNTVSHLLLSSNFDVNLKYKISDVAFTGEKICGALLVKAFLNFKDTVSPELIDEFGSMLCGLNGDLDRAKRIVQTIVPRLNARDLIKSALELSPSHLLSSSNLTMEETQHFVKEIKPLSSQLGSFVSSIKDIVPSNTSQNSNTAAMLESFGEQFCGDSKAFNFGEYGASFLSSDMAEEEEKERKGEIKVVKEPDWTEFQQEEMKAFNDPFCVKMYKNINGLAGIGPILWSFIKPLTRGKVLFTPNTTETRAIMQEAYWLFDSVHDVKEITQMWLKFAEKDQNAVPDNSKPEPVDLAKVLRNPLVSATVQQTTGISGAEIADDIEGTADSITENDLDRVTEMAESIQGIMNCLDYDLIGFASDEDMRVAAEKHSATDTLFAAIQFRNMKPDKKDNYGRLLPRKFELPKHVEYILRMTQEQVALPNKLFAKVKESAPDDDFFDDLRYFWGFVMLQDLLDHAIIKVQMAAQNVSAVLPKIHTQSFPYPCYDQDDFMTWSSFVIVVILLFSWLCMMAVGITNAVSEKESGIEDTMKVMGMKGGVNRLAWFTNTLLGMIFLSAFVTALIRGGSLVRHSDPILIFLWLSSYSVSIVMLCYLVSALVHRTNLASLFGLLVYLMLCIPFIILHSMDVVFGLSFKNKVIMSLSVTSAFCFGANELIIKEKNGHGITWETAWNPVDETFPFAWSGIMISIDSIFYLIVAWYISNKFPGSHGLPAPWYFPLSPSYWGCNDKGAGTYDPEAHTKATANSRHVPGEPEPRNLKVGISICGLSKIYNDSLNSCLGQLYQRLTGKKRLKAVDNLSVNFFEGQITAFLGHNGAGKSTCIHMLTGLIQPSDGIAYIGGYSIKDGFETIRKSLGFCPQHDVLFDYMTIKEHFMFYARMKGHGSYSDTIEEVDRMLELTGLRKFKEIPVRQLSGGQRRRVSVGNAFIGGSKVIILDEPTSGVDPAARRLIWDIIAKHKKGRTILLCTHHLDEADVLGDRIVIVHQGKLICHGTSLWLKTQYGSGYNLTISKRLGECPESPGIVPSNRPSIRTWSTPRVLRFVKRLVPGAEVVEEFGTEVTIVLPKHRRTQTNFQKLFMQLEARALDFNIDKYGVADSTLEEVFLKVTRLAEEGKSLDPKRVKHSHMRRHRRRTSISSLESGNVDEYDVLPCDAASYQAALSEDASSGIMPPSADNVSYDLNGSSIHRGSLTNSTYTPKQYDSGSVAGSIYSTFSQSEKGSMTDVELVDGMDGKLNKTNLNKGRSVGLYLKWRQFNALLYKRLRHHGRDLRSHVSQIVLPALFVCLAMVATWFKPSLGRYIPFRLDASMYGPNQTIFYSMYNTSELAEEMLETTRHRPGVGTLCLPLETLNPSQWSWLNRSCGEGYREFHLEDLPKEKQRVYERYPNCSCNTGTWTCPAEAAGPPRPTMMTHTGDKLVDLTDYPKGVEEFLLRTFDVFEGVNVGGTFGGWTFDNEDDRTAATVWFNNKGVHALPSFYNALNNMALRANIKMATNKSADGYGITVHSQPYNTSTWPITTNGLLMSFSDTGVSLTIMIAYCFVPASFIIYVINERMRQEKRLQFLTGVGIGLYWFSALLWDMLTYAVTVALTIGIAKAFDLHVYTYGENLQALCCMLMLFGWATTPLMYLLSRWFTNAATGYVAAFIINLCIGINTTASIFFLQTPIFNSRPEIVLARKILTNGMLIFPQFCLGDSLVKLAYNQIITDIMNIFHINQYTSPFSTDLLFYHFLTLGMEGAVFFIIHLVVEINMCDNRKALERHANHKEDSDVGLERQRVITGGAENDMLLIYRLSKVYHRAGLQTTLAVDNLCVGVPRGECFGLLGVNGAGKTTSFKMITGEIHPSFGAAILKGEIISEDASNFNQNVGYCPQFDALDDFLTGEEMIYYYSNLRGIPSDDIPEVITRFTKKFDLGRHIKKRVGAYSAGNKRKLSIALALIGDPELVLLDEPTTGMDPGTRRLVWDNIIEVIKDNRSVILTSHSMEECDALCTRMAIMVNGTFQCMGSSQHLKNKFGSGYTVSMHIGGGNRDVRKVIHFIKSKFKGSWVKDRHLNMVEFGIASRSSTLATLFRRLERERINLKIDNYSVTQTTLDNVFLHFARKQSDNMFSEEEVYDRLSRVDDTESRASDFDNEDSFQEEVSISNETSNNSLSDHDPPPSYHSRPQSGIAPNSFENPHISSTLDNMDCDEEDVYAQVQDMDILQEVDEELEHSLEEGTIGGGAGADRWESSVDTGALGGTESNGESSNGSSMGDNRTSTISGNSSNR